MFGCVGAIMTVPSIKKFSWLRNPTVVERNRAWRARQQEIRGSFESANSAASSRFANANINQVAGLGQIVANAASQRMQREAIQRQLNLIA